MGKIIRLTESDLTRLVKRVIQEQSSSLTPRQKNIYNTILSLKFKNPSDKDSTLIITNPKHRDNGKTWDDYIKTYKISHTEVKKLYSSLNAARIQEDILMKVAGSKYVKPQSDVEWGGVVR